VKDETKRCAECKHWGHPEEDGYVNDDRRNCLRIVASAPEGEPKPIADEGECGSMNPRLVTPPDFGCVLWEAKP
jgi:hypothetical protein